jgi:hypothetical protein
MQQADGPGAASARTASRHRYLTVVGLLLLALWSVLCIKSLTDNRLVLGTKTWVDPWSFLGLDFLNNYHAARQWFAGGDPYVKLVGDLPGREYCYPPVMLPCFFWCTWLSPRGAVIAWTAALGLLAGLGVWWAARSRCELGVWPVPLTLLLACVLFSTPLVFAMERGNCDLLIIPLVVVAAWALEQRSPGRDAVGGACLAVAVALKLYPAFLLAGLVPLRRFRAFGFGLVALTALINYRAYDLPLFWQHLQDMIASSMPAIIGGISPTTHTLSGTWTLLWKGNNMTWLRGVSPTAGALALVTPGVLFFCYRLFRSNAGGKLTYPYLLWLAAAATFIPQVSNDYNFFFLLLAAMAVWARRDRVAVHLGMALLILWAQPLALAIGPRLLLGFKFISLWTVALSLLARTEEQAEAVEEKTIVTFPAVGQAAAAA